MLKIVLFSQSLWKLVISIMIILVITAYALLAFYEFIPLYRQKLWPDLWVNAVIGISSFIIAVLFCFDVKIPSPVKPIREFIILIIGK